MSRLVISGRVHGLTGLLAPAMARSPRVVDTVTAQADPPEPPDPPPGVDPQLEEPPDLATLDEAWEAALAALLAGWMAGVVPAWTDALAVQVQDALTDGDLVRLSALPLDSIDAAAELAAGMGEYADTVADLAVDEGEEQDVELTPTVPPQSEVAGTAIAVAAMVAASVALSAGAEALRIWTPGGSVGQTTSRVRTHLEGLSEARHRDALGWALSDTGTATRMATFLTGPLADFYADERRDQSACQPCREVDGLWLGSSTDRDAVDVLYPTGVYIGCLGGTRCRGTVVPKFRKAGR